jgi:hypothetical protein
MTAKKKVVKKSSVFLGVDTFDYQSEFATNASGLEGYPIIIEFVGEFQPKKVVVNLD